MGQGGPGSCTRRCQRGQVFPPVHHVPSAAARLPGRWPAVEGYPVDNRGIRVDLTMAYVGTRKLFEDAGFTKAADTTSVAGGFPRVLMRLDLR